MLASLVCLTLGAQIRYEWTPVPVDSTWDRIDDPAATLIIEKYKPQLGCLQEILGYARDEYSKDRPESPLSDLASDIIRDVAGKAAGCPVDVGLINFGGIRTSLPKGTVRVYDIYSIFPFDNSVVYFDIKGSDLRKLVEHMVGRGRIESMSNVRIVVRDGVLASLTVSGNPVADDAVYKLATINFLMYGGDGLKLSEAAMNYVDTGIWVRDAIVDYFREHFQGKAAFSLSTDGRVQIFEK